MSASFLDGYLVCEYGPSGEDGGVVVASGVPINELAELVLRNLTVDDPAEDH